MSKLRIILAHDKLSGISGTERVIRALTEIFPKAPLVTLDHDRNFTRDFLPNTRVVEVGRQFGPSFLSRRGLAPLMPFRVESIDLRDFDVVISSSTCWLKGLILRPTTVHINYCHSPTRQLWDWHLEYQKEARRVPKSITKILQHTGRIWDHAASLRVDHFIANSKLTQSRIKKYYQRDSEIIYPPVEMPDWRYIEPQLKDRGYYLIVSRLFQHKNIELAIRTFNKMKWPLVIIGDGPDLEKLKSQAESNIRFMGYQSENIVRRYYAECRAFVLPNEEDFGIAAVEAMSYGKPVLALRRGGALEYIKEGTNGLFLDQPIEEVMAYGLKCLNDAIVKKEFDPKKIRSGVERFSKERFQKEILGFVENMKGTTG